MFEAYSSKASRTITVNQATDTNEIFGCPNPYCSARFKLKAINSEKKTHFSRLSSTQHIQGCPYALGNISYVNSNELVKYTVEDIFNNTNKPHSSFQSNSNKTLSCNSSDAIFIRTPKELLMFCLSNSIETLYTDNLFVDNIILDSRNLLTDARFKGIEGLRVLVGLTENFKFRNSKCQIIFNVISKTMDNKPINLHAKIYVSEEQGQELINYILNTYNNAFKGHSIAVFGNWVKTSNYNVEYTVKNKRHVIYKFCC